jgi:signal transduction histidine kinase
MTHRLLALAKPETMEREAVDLTVLSGGIVSLLRPQAALDGVEVRLKCPPALPGIMGDPVQMEQVLVNLVLNGVQAMQSDGGTLTVALRRRQHSARRGVCVSISDTGPGIPLSARRRLFDPFFTTKPDGAGLGLFSCRRIAEAHAGTLRVRSRIGIGTQVLLWLPCENPTVEGEGYGRQNPDC